ncbi:MAG: right-handed parallel beta-helix repeat-containing protein [Deltaproteobacteria bacterium]|nr:right-handed parallel beta-helix repeat-containing protein [Deltaproteobacteria bacterium]
MVTAARPLAWALLAAAVGCSIGTERHPDASMADAGSSAHSGLDASRPDAEPPASGDAAVAGADASPGADAGPSGCGDPESMIPSWITSFAPAREIYVDPSGDDGQPGTSPQAAVRTTSRALALAQPGTRLNFAPGTYSGGQLSNFAGTRQAPLVIRSSGAARSARFDGGGGVGFQLSKVHAVVFDGIEVFNTSGHGIQVDSGAAPWDVASISSDIAILHSFIHDTGYASTKMSQTRSVWVIGNLLTRAGRAVAGRQNVEFVAVDDTVVAGNEATDSGGHFNEVKGGAKNAVLYRNYVHDNGGGILVGGDCTGVQYLTDPSATYEALNVQVWDNVVVNAPSEAFRIVSCHQCLVANNTSWSVGNQTNALKIVDIGFGSAAGTCDQGALHNEDLTIVNNVFAAARFAWVTASNSAAIPGLVLHHNAWSGVAGTGGDVPFKGDPDSLYDVNLGLAGPPADLRPGASSPLVGKGVEVPQVPGNADGTCWILAPNIGAY